MPSRRLIRAAAFLAFGLVLQACAGKAPPALALMPAPDAFDIGAFDRDFSRAISRACRQVTAGLLTLTRASPRCTTRLRSVV